MLARIVRPWGPWTLPVQLPTSAWRIVPCVALRFGSGMGFAPSSALLQRAGYRTWDAAIFWLRFTTDNATSLSAAALGQEAVDRIVKTIAVGFESKDSR